MTIFYFSKHAIERYIRRHDRSLSLEDARSLLDQEAQHAVNLHKRSAKNDADEWEIPTLGIRLLVRDDNTIDATEAPRKIVVTILPQRVALDVNMEQVQELQQEAEVVFVRVRAERAAAEQAVVKAKHAVTFAAGHEPPEKRKLLKKQVSYREVELAEAKWTYKAATVALEETKLLLAAVREVELTKRHRANQTESLSLHRRVIRVAVEALVQLNAHEALSKIEQIDPTFVSDEFLHGYGKRAIKHD